MYNIIGTMDEVVEDAETDDDGDHVDSDVSYAATCCTSSSQMRSPLHSVARECDRHGVSDRVAASIVSAAFRDVGLIDDSDRTSIVDRSKIRRERSRSRLMASDSATSDPLVALYFDGRKDKTIIQEKVIDKFHRREVLEEHISLVQQPGSSYLGHVAPTTSNAADTSNAIISFLNDKSINCESLIAIGCDGCNVNTGNKNGIIHLLEVHLNRPLHWFICLLHVNELPLRHIFHYLDGATTGPRSFTGEIGKAIQSCEKLPVVNFQAIPDISLPVLPAHVLDDLSSDQKYLYNICQALQSGNCSADLAQVQPGTLSHSRWLTAANRILRLYISVEEPSNSLLSLTKFVVMVYATSWFRIKLHPNITQGPYHLWRMIKDSEYLPAELRAIVNKCLQRNAFFAHEENILMAMLFDARPHMVQLALRRILKYRSISQGVETPRAFKIPALNFNSDDYTSMISWTNASNEPPLTRSIPTTKLSEMLAAHSETNSLDLLKLDLPCHTQAVERCVKNVTFASANVCGHERRDGLIRCRLQSCATMPAFNTKKDFNT